MANMLENMRIQKAHHDKVFNTETMLPISEIQSDTVILKDGGLRGIIRVEGLNLDLKNYDEQIIVMEQYKRFLNGMDFPLQILIRNSYLDLRPYLEYMKKNVALINNKALLQQGKEYISFMENINLQQGLIYTKEFYFIVPYYSYDDNGSVNKARWNKVFTILDSKDGPEKIVSKYRNFIKHKKNIDSRCDLIIEGLRGMGMEATRLQLPEIINLLFKCYNPSVDASQA